MPTLLYWNLENLTRDKYGNADIQRVISNGLMPGGAGFSLVVIVEVHTRARGRAFGQVYDTGGTQGLYLIYGLLYAANNNWRCVPPISTGTGCFSEAVGILYRSDVLNFQGPHVWSTVDAA